uniref:PIN domain-containing protein n=1 Tax=Stenotrophomonas sp. YIM B06876 TaxID=3060211 RepID=UPI00273A23F9
DHTGVDLAAAVEHKLRKNAIKHPAKRALAAASAAAPVAMLPTPKPAESGGPKVHLLVDWENVQPRGEQLQALAPRGTDVWLFHNPQQRIDKTWHADYGERVTPVPIARPGKNALDFHLSYYMGYISARQPDATFMVISNDKGYDPMLEHARNLGFLATRREFCKTVAAAPPVQAEKIPEKMLSEMANEQQAMPAQKKPPNMLPAKSAPAAKKTAPKKKTAAAATRAAQPSPAAKKTPAPPKKPAAKASAALAQKAAPSLTAAEVARRVLASLAKMPSNKPARKPALLSMIRSHAGVVDGDDSMATLVLSLLQAQGAVAEAGAGKALTYPKLKARAQLNSA